MTCTQQTLSSTFNRFFDSEKAGGILLILCTAFSVAAANSPFGPDYLHLWHVSLGGLSIETWINDAMMAIFFLLIGLELERELYIGELSHFKNALLPILAAVGGMVIPAMIHYSLNSGTPTQAGIGIPMATDIAFALGVLSLLGNRIPPSLKVFIVAYAVIDDLGTVILVAVFYTKQLSMWYLTGALIIWGLLFTLNRLRLMSMIPYLLGGTLMWFLTLKSGVHATIAGVMLAFAIPFSGRDENGKSPSHKLEHLLHKPVAFGILPLFALANTGVLVNPEWLRNIGNSHGLGIVAGLVIGKPLGVTALSLIAMASGICGLPPGMHWSHIMGAGVLGGIGFTMSIFIANLAFAGEPETINASKLAILTASLTAGTLGFLWLRIFGGQGQEGKNT
jgi:Na+:H+ antiporter, NhaA family